MHECLFPHVQVEILLRQLFYHIGRLRKFLSPNIRGGIRMALPVRLESEDVTWDAALAKFSR